jgi:Domain of unknown function (DUF4331)
MKKLMLSACLLACLVTTLYLFAADHLDSPAVHGKGSDITDYYAFQSPENANNIVFVINVQGLLSPSETGSASFDEDVMLELNIDNSSAKDNIEDLVIQATFDDGRVNIYGPIAPSEKGINSTLMNSSTSVEAMITKYGAAPMVGNTNGIKVFAGPRDDPFFFDLAAYNAVVTGAATAFNDPWTDTFAGTNVLSVVVEVPKSLLGSGTINTWVTANRKM